MAEKNNVPAWLKGKAQGQQVGGPRNAQGTTYGQGYAQLANYYANDRTYRTGANERREYMVNGNRVRMAPNSELTVRGNRQPKENPVPAWINKIMGRDRDNGRPSGVTTIRG